MDRNPDIRAVGAIASQKPIQTITLVRLSTELGWIARQQQASTSRASRIGSTRRARHELACDPESMPPARLRRHGARLGERRSRWGCRIRPRLPPPRPLWTGGRTPRWARRPSPRPTGRESSREPANRRRWESSRARRRGLQRQSSGVRSSRSRRRRSPRPHGTSRRSRGRAPLTA